MNRETGRLKVSAVLTAPSSITCEVGRFRSLIWDRHVNMFDHKLEPKPSVARRVEVFTGTGRRRRWSSDEKVRILEETLAVGAVVSEVARRHGITSIRRLGSPTLFPRSPRRRRPGSANSYPGTGYPTAARAPQLNRGPPRRVTGLLAVEAACLQALSDGVHSADVIINILARQRDPGPAATIMTPDALRLRHAPIADCARYDQLRSA